MVSMLTLGLVGIRSASKQLQSIPNTPKPRCGIWVVLSHQNRLAGNFEDELSVLKLIAVVREVGRKIATIVGFVYRPESTASEKIPA